MRISYAPWGETLDEQVAAAVDAEAAGFADVWVSELTRSAFVPATAIARATRTAGVGTAIALAFVRSPLTTALSALDVDEASGGRFTLGLGSGVQRLNEDWHNARFGRAVPHLRETVAAVRTIVAQAHRGRPIEIGGEYEPVRIRGWERPAAPVRERIPVYLAGVGDAMCRLAGEIGDGWLGHELGSPRYLAERIVPALEEGVRRAARGNDRPVVVPGAVCMIDRDGRQARRLAAGIVAFYATVRTYRDFFAWHGFAAEAERIGERFRAGDREGMIDACTDEMVDALVLAGTVDEVRKRLAAYEGIAGGVKLSPPAHIVPAEVSRAAQAAILEHLAP